MAAGASKEQITRRKRQLLQAIAAKHGGRYTRATPTTGALVYGKDEAEVTVHWTATYGHGNMSNGETVLTLEVQCWIDPSVGPPVTFRHLSVPAAILAYRLDLAAAAQKANPETDSGERFLDGDGWEGQTGDFARLFHVPPFTNVFGDKYALTLRGEGFEILRKEDSRVLTFKKDSADFWSRDLFVILRPDLRGLSRPNHYDAARYKAADESEAALRKMRGEGLDGFAIQFDDLENTHLEGDGWKPSPNDWRLAHGPSRN
jgi:hypothetical protein